MKSVSCLEMAQLSNSEPAQSFVLYVVLASDVLLMFWTCVHSDVISWRRQKDIWRRVEPKEPPPLQTTGKSVQKDLFA